jgi:hypothetical protein
VTQDLGHDMIGGRGENGGGGEASRACDESSDRSGRDGKGGQPVAPLGGAGPLEHGDSESGADLVLSCQLALLGGR